MKPRLLKSFRLDCDFADKTLRSKGQVNQMFMLHTYEGRIIPVGFGGGEKEAVYRMVRLIAVVHDAEAVSSIGEAWTLPPGPRLPDVLPSQSERRIEVVAVQLRPSVRRGRSSATPTAGPLAWGPSACRGPSFGRLTSAASWRMSSRRSAKPDAAS